jgi:hypothetical protein
MYIEGLKTAGIIKEAGASDDGGSASRVPGKPHEARVDYASGFIPKGFNRRTT